jgi:hypothetical protein
MSAAAPVVPMQEGTPAKPLSALAMKVMAQQEEQSKKSQKGRVIATVGQQKDEAFVLFKMLDFVTAIGKSESGKTEGCTLQVTGEFTVPIEGLGDVTYVIESNAWVKARVKVDQSL